jgi:hypothetical protein
VVIPLPQICLLVRLVVTVVRLEGTARPVVLRLVATVRRHLVVMVHLLATRRNPA